VENYDLVGPAVKKKNTTFRNAIIMMECLAITRFPANGDLYHSMMYLFKVSAQSMSLIIPQVCEALINADTSLQFVELETDIFTYWRWDLGELQTTQTFNKAKLPSCKNVS
jgi:hypothetical protein